MEGCSSVCHPMVLGNKINLDEGEWVDETFYKKKNWESDVHHKRQADVQFYSLMLSLTQPHVHAAKRVLRYLKGTLDYGIWYKRGGAMIC